VVAGLPVWVWCLLMGVGSSWLVGPAAGSGAWLGVALVGVGVGLEWCVAGAVDAGWLGTSVDRAGSAVCLAWLVLFEVAFFFGAVWMFALCLDQQGHSVGLWGAAGDAGVGSGVVGGAWCAMGAGTCSWAACESAGVMGKVLLPVLGSLVVLMVVSLVLQLVHRGSGAVGGNLGPGAGHHGARCRAG
jgi:hypothetical protein